MKACDKCGGTGRIPDDRIYGAEMRKFREAAGITARTVARRLEVSASYLSDLEHGRRRWTPKLIFAYTTAVEDLR